MSWTLTQKEHSSVRALPPSTRYEYAVKRIADNAHVWGLMRNRQWAICLGPDGKEHMPVWPHKDFAADCVDQEWKGYRPCAIEIDEWLEVWLPGLEEDGRMIAAFPVDMEFGSISPSNMLRDLRSELAKYG